MQSLQTLANQAGNRLGLLRMMTETRRQAATERVREALALAVVDGTTPRFTASFGVTHTDEGAETLEDLLRRADQALYAAKEAGRNRTFRSDVAVPAAAEESGR